MTFIRTKMKKAVVLLSGGLDSTTCAAIAKSEGYELYALTFDYNQRHIKEIEYARLVAEMMGVKEHSIVLFDFSKIGVSALTSDIDVPMDRELGDEIPVTYVPARNTVFLSFALAYAETIGTGDIFIGVSQIDYSGYPDCRSEYIEAFEKMANLATKQAVTGECPIRIHTPLINLTKAETIRLGLSLGVDYDKTWSCYSGGDNPCGHCDSCKLREAAFKKIKSQNI